MRRLASVAVVSAMATTLVLSGCASTFDSSFTANPANIANIECTKVSDLRKELQTEDAAPADSPLHSELVKHGITNAEEYNAALKALDEHQKVCNDASKKAPAPDPYPSVSASPSTIPSSTATPASASATATPIYCWGELRKHLSKEAWSDLLVRIDRAKDQLNFSSADVEGWSKLNVDCRVIVAFDSTEKKDRPADDVTRSIAAKKIGGGSLADVSVVQADSSVQVAGEARINLSGDSGVKVILSRIVNGKSVPSSGVVISQEDTGGSSYILLAGISWLK